MFAACGHAFCEKCYDQMAESNSCPLCREQTLRPPETLDELGFGEEEDAEEGEPPASAPIQSEHASHARVGSMALSIGSRS